MESYFDPRKLVPRFYRMRLKEGRYQSYREVTFDQEQHHATYSRDRRPSQTSPTVAAVQDPLSSLYVVRTLPLQVGKSVYLPIFDRGKTCLTEIQVLSRERLRLAIGEVSTLKLKPLLQTAGIFNRDGELFVWLTDDARRVPVQMHSTIAIGAITARVLRISCSLFAATFFSSIDPVLNVKINLSSHSRWRSGSRTDTSHLHSWCAMHAKPATATHTASKRISRPSRLHRDLWCSKMSDLRYLSRREDQGNEFALVLLRVISSTV